MALKGLMIFFQVGKGEFHSERTERTEEAHRVRSGGTLETIDFRQTRTAAAEPLARSCTGSSGAERSDM